MISVLALSVSISTFLLAQNQDSVLCHRALSYASEQNLIDQPVGKVIVELAKQFIGRPYEAHTLDRQPAESIVVNLHSFDCVTFIENVLALTRCVKRNQLSFDAYRGELARIRYRGGVMTGYCSRLHYFSEWIRDNENKGSVQDITRYFGGEEVQRKIHFMTDHRKQYSQLSADSNFTQMKAIEKRLSETRSYLIPKKEIQAAEQKIRDGDIIAIATTIPGLDVAHTGIAVRTTGGEVHLIHAPDEGGSVRISDEPLWKYVSKNPKNSGIMIARVVDFAD